MYKNETRKEVEPVKDGVVAHCTSCRKDLMEEGVKREPLGKDTGRFSLFCKSCLVFLKVVETPKK